MSIYLSIPPINTKYNEKSKGKSERNNRWVVKGIELAHYGNLCQLIQNK